MRVTLHFFEICVDVRKAAKRLRMEKENTRSGWDYK